MQNNLYHSFIRKSFSFILLASVFSGSFSVAAQTRRAPTKTVKTVSTDNQKESCKGGWSGIVTYQKTLSHSESSQPQKSVTTVKTKHAVSREYVYKGRIVIDGSDPRMAQTDGQASLSDDRTKSRRSEDREDCRYDKAPPIDVFIETKETEATRAFGEGEAQFNLMVNPVAGTYGFSFRLPEAKGVTDLESATTAKQCVKKDYPPTAKKLNALVPGTGARVENERIDPKNPDVLSGTKTWDDNSTSNSSRFQHTVSWVFKRCPAPIEVTAIEFDENPYVNPWNGDLAKAKKTWRRITRSDDTIDGNRVRIRARVVNFSGETRFPTVKFHEMVENWELPGETSIRLEAGEEKEIAVEWDTSGYAWIGKGRYAPESNRKIKVEAIDEGKVSDLTETIVISPRPVVLVHGLWANAGTWNEFKTFFREAHSVRWESFAVGEDAKVGKMQTGDRIGGTEPTRPIEENSAILMNQIEAVREKLNAWHVDLVAHSMGGLISRFYVQNRMPPSIDEKPVATKLLMLGTPNLGSPCADLLYNSLFQYGNGSALRELKPSVVAEFNRLVTRRRGVRFSSLVGRAIPKTCQSFEGGDGVVPISSAIWQVFDWRYSPSLTHTDLTSHADFGGFVFPRLAVGPRGNHDIELISENEFEGDGENYAALGDDAPRPADRYGFGDVFQKASYQKQNQTDIDAAPANLIAAKEVKLQPNQTAEIEIPAGNASRAAIVFVAPANVSAVLLDAANKIVGENRAGTPAAKQMFRMIAVDKLFVGNLKLKFESREPEESIVLAAAFADANSIALTISAGKPNAAKQIPLQAKLTKNDAPIAGASVRATIKTGGGKTFELNLLDDGKNGDGAAGDGIYGATAAEKLEAGDYLVEAIADFDGQKHFAAASLSVGAETKPTTKTAKGKK